MASHLHVPVAELKKRLSSREFATWKVFLEEERTQTTADQMYMAQVSREIRRSYVKSPKKVKLNDFILEFSKTPSNTEANEQTANQSKSFWLSALGIKDE